MIRFAALDQMAPLPAACQESREEAQSFNKTRATYNWTEHRAQVRPATDTTLISEDICNNGHRDYRRAFQ